MSAAAEGWAFLVARGRRVGYLTLLAPGFLIDEQLHDELAAAVDKTERGLGAARVSELDVYAAEPLSVGYTAERITLEDLGAEPSGGALTDQHGRPLVVVYGIVVRGRMDEPPASDDLRFARAQALRTYERFLADEEGHRVETSSALRLDSPIELAPAAVAHEPPGTEPARSARSMRVLLAVGAVALGALLIAYALLASTGESTTVRGVSGSEKEPFFKDPEVVAAFDKHDLRVTVETAGSRSIATTTNLAGYDFAFPAGVQAAQRIEHKLRRSREYPLYQPFQTPLAISSFRKIARLLRAEGVVAPVPGTGGDYWRLDLRAYLRLVDRDVRWRDLRGNRSGEIYDTGRRVLISSTDVRTSNSAALYLAIASYVANGDSIVQDDTQAKRVARRVAPIFTRQGYAESSTEGVFEDYLLSGPRTPLAMIYEAQFLARRAAGDGSIKPDMVLMYPQPNVLTKHTLVPRTAAGDRVGRLLSSDPELQRLAAEHGFVPRTPGTFNRYLASKHVRRPPTLSDDISAPTPETLETMIRTVAGRLGGDVPPPSPGGEGG